MTPIRRQPSFVDAAARVKGSASPIPLSTFRPHAPFSGPISCRYDDAGSMLFYDGACSGRRQRAVAHTHIYIAHMKSLEFRIDQLLSEAFI